MAALLNRNDIVEDLQLGASGASFNVYSRFIRKIIEQTVLPRKILIQSDSAGVEFLVDRGEVVRYQELDQKETVWVQYPQSTSESDDLQAFEDRAGAVLKNGHISLSVVEADEARELAAHKAKQDIKSTVEIQDSSEIVYLASWKTDKEVKSTTVEMDEASKINDFVCTIGSVAKFLCHFDVATGKAVTEGSSVTLDKDASEGLWPDLMTWNEATSGALSKGPKLIVIRSDARSESLQFFATDGRQSMIAEVSANKFGVVLGLWKTTTQTG